MNVLKISSAVQARRPANCRLRAGTCHQHGKTGKAGADDRFSHTTNLRGFPPAA
jgi:hypothetical protein